MVCEKCDGCAIYEYCEMVDKITDNALYGEHDLLMAIYSKGIKDGKAELKKEYEDIVIDLTNEEVRRIKQDTRLNTIDECKKLVGGNTKTIVGVVFDKSIPIDDRAYARCIKNKFIEELVEQLEKLKEQSS